MRVPSIEEIKKSLQILEVKDNTDSMGRVIRKNNYSQFKPNKVFNKGKPKGRGKYD